MKQLERLIDRIISRVNINLREFAFDVDPYVRKIIPLIQFSKFYAFYGLTPYHPLHFRFSQSSLAGSYFLGKCSVDHSILYKSDVRGDELKRKGDMFKFQDWDISLHEDEAIHIKDSYLIKNLVHNFSHDPENPEEFFIHNTVSTHFANIHGSPVEGCFLGPFSTVDLTTLHDCVIGTFSYLQVGELFHQMIEPGKIWIRSENAFDFSYQFSEEVLDKYIRFETGKSPRGLFMDFIESRKGDFQRIFQVVDLEPYGSVASGAALSRYAVVKGKTRIGENVLVAQRAFLENAWLGKGANAQENCYIIDSRLEGNNVTAHGGKIIHGRLGEKVFVGFNAFLYGKRDCPLTIGKESIVMPHTIIDLDEPLNIPARHLIWGYIRNRRDLETHTLSLKSFSEIQGEFSLGPMHFQGSGLDFVKAFKHRIEHILKSNGAYFDGKKNRGHAQKDQDISFNTIQPYPKGRLKGLYPTIEIRP